MEIGSTNQFPYLYPPTNDIKYFEENIVLCYYNITRHQDTKEFADFFDHLLGSLKKEIEMDSQSFFPYLCLLYRLLGQSRDCIMGKGEHEISYAMLAIWYKYYPVLAIFALHSFVKQMEENQPYGSWRDIKYFCDYLRKYTSQGEQHPFIHYCIQMMNTALYKDIHLWNQLLSAYFLEIYNSTSMEDMESIHKPLAREHLSTVAKWVPRENKQFDWVHERLVNDWFETYHPEMELSLSDRKMNYRKIVAKLNKDLDTTEIKLCSQKWDEIVPKNIPQLSLSKHQPHLYDNNIQLNNYFIEYTHSKYEKKICAQQFHNHFEQKFFVKTEPTHLSRPTTIAVSQFIKEAYSIIKRQRRDIAKYSGSHHYQLQIDVLNKKWFQLSSTIGLAPLKQFIPLVDFSFDMSNQTEQFYTSIGLALLIGERSSYGKRILAIDNEPIWIQLQDCNDLFSMVLTIYNHTNSYSRTHYNIEKAFDLILTSMVDTKMSYYHMSQLSIVLFDNQNHQTCDFQKTIIELFRTKGILYSPRKIPLPMPRIIFWNIAETFSSFPFQYNIMNTFYISGLSTASFEQLYLLYNKQSAFQVISHILGNHRYDLLENYIHQIRK
jgi:hypothetical protein